MNIGLNWAYFMFNNHFRKYFRYVQMMSFMFETIIEFSAAIRNVNAHLVLMNRGLTFTYIKLIWMLLWDPLTYLFHWGTRVLVVIFFGSMEVSTPKTEGHFGVILKHFSSWECMQKRKSWYISRLLAKIKFINTQDKTNLHSINLSGGMNFPKSVKI